MISGQARQAPNSLWPKSLAQNSNAGYLATRALPLLILSVIPGINVVAPFLWALFRAWGMALEYMAYPLENEGVLFAEQQQLAKA
jgi:CysZ protein